MSVTGVADVLLRPLGGPLAPRAPGYPAYFWEGRFGITGDASGGIMEVDLIIEATARLTSRMFSFEGYWINDPQALADVGRIALVGFGTLIEGNSPLFVLQVPVVSSGANVAGSHIPASESLRPNLPPFRHRQGVNLFTSFRKNINTNTVVMEYSAWGWVWEARAINEGIVRPQGW